MKKRVRSFDNLLSIRRTSVGPYCRALGVEVYSGDLNNNTCCWRKLNLRLENWGLL